MSRLDTSSPAAVPEPPAEEKSTFEASSSSAIEDQTPDWLKSLQPPESKPVETPVTPASGENFPDWFSGLPGISAENIPESSTSTGGSEEPAALGNLPDWLSELKEKSAQLEPIPPETGSDAPISGENIPDWLGQLQERGNAPESMPPVAEAGIPASKHDLPDWLNILQEKNADTEAATPPDSPGGEIPSMENLPDWLNQLQGSGVESDLTTPAAKGDSVPDWLSGLGPEGEAPISASGEKVPGWLSDLESKPVSTTEPSEETIGVEPRGEATSAGETPSWLSQSLTDITAAEEVEHHKDDFDVVSEPPDKNKRIEPLPEWLSGIESTAPVSSGPPALIIDNKSNAAGETAFSMEAPDWLSKLKPEQRPEKSGATAEDQTPAADLEAAALPSWVQAMRPVESVVDEARASSLNGGPDYRAEWSVGWLDRSFAIGPRPGILT